MAKGHPVHVRRIYDDPSPADGARILVDRLWPRGVSKERADLTKWLKDVAPSTGLRKWYSHDPAKFAEFSRRYRAELADDDHAEAFAALREYAEKGPVTLLTASKHAEISEAAVLDHVLQHSPDEA
ncbi:MULTISPECIES: DUF488 family protein [Brevibacterium]|jgi:uncharacterized protein YeaO (DUF488 family)|uniref:DUF488 domain-containing protein n=1 Tax=Brevibacterium TaxID=1696 RepID=UPI0031D673A6